MEYTPIREINTTAKVRLNKLYDRKKSLENELEKVNQMIAVVEKDYPEDKVLLTSE